jgi:EAL domain-containing protein (putative c-di-GMP-specific phosphodiesterase class I)
VRVRTRRPSRSLLRVEYQPIVDLDSGQPCAFEALVHVDAGTRLSPAGWAAAADVAGVGVPMEHRVAAAAFAALDVFPAPVRVSVNASPEYLSSDRLRDALGVVDAGRVLIELSGWLRVPDYRAFARSLFALRALGATIALDDAGSELYTLSRAASIRPDIIKLDPSLTVAAVEGGPLAAHARGVVSYARAVDAPVIAQGISTPEELLAVTALGVRLGQGDLLGQCHDLAHWRRAVPRPSSRRSA